MSDSVKSDEEGRFVDTLQELFPEFFIEVEFSDGYCGLEDMSFPSWTIRVHKEDGSVEAKRFYDKLQYRRRFGDTRFHFVAEHADDAYDWISSFLEK